MILFVFARFLEGGRNPESASVKNEVVVVVVFYLFADILIVQWPIRTTAKKQNSKSPSCQTRDSSSFRGGRGNPFQRWRSSNDWWPYCFCLFIFFVYYLLIYYYILISFYILMTGKEIDRGKS